MSYHQRIPKVKKYVDEMIERHPDLKDDPLFAQIVYEGLKLCPRVHGTIKKTIMRGLFDHLFNIREEQFKRDDGQGTFTGLVIREKLNP